MKRTKGGQRRKVDAILTGDWHLRDDAPICRTDNFQEAQWKKVEFVSELQRKHQCVVHHAGDLFDYWKPSPALLSACILNLPDSFQTILGNHDIPQHNLDLAWKCGVHTLAVAERVILLNGYHWGQTLSPGDESHRMALWHTMTWKGKKPWPGIIDKPAKEILKEYPQYDLILTGHNHKRFVEELDGRLLVNPGALTRQTADQEDHVPGVYLWYAEDNTIEEVILPHEKGVISREHIARVEQRDARIDAFISRLNEDWETGVSFEDNLERFLSSNKIHSSVVEIVRKAVFP